MQRHVDLVRTIRQRGFVSIDDLAAQFDVTPQTIRRDINALAAEGRLVRHHGGAAAPSSAINVDFDDRQLERLAEKQAIAAALVADIPDRSSLFLSLGTTMGAVAEALLRRDRLKIVTNNPLAALALNRNETFEVFLTGGAMRKTNGGLTGTLAIQTIEQFRCDFAIIGVGGVEADGTLVDYDHAEVMAVQAMLRCCRAALVAADHSKMLRPAAVRVAHVADVAALYTDRPLPRALQAAGMQTTVKLGHV